MTSGLIRFFKEVTRNTELQSRLYQTTELSDLLTWAKTPVTITLTSDSQTDVTLLRVKRLGTFGSTQLTLRPGSYTALGVRNGYRDVRINFDIKPGGETVIDVRCQEAI